MACWRASERRVYLDTGGVAAKMGSVKPLANPLPDGLGLMLIAYSNVRAPHHVPDKLNMWLHYV